MLSASFRDCFGDERLDKRGNKFIRDLLVKGTHSIRQISRSSSDQKGVYRFLKNGRTTEALIVKSMGARCGAAVKGKVVLSIQDTTEINLYKHRGRIKKDGTVGVTNAPKNGLGFMVHPSLVVDAATCMPYGYCDVHIWNRSAERKAKRPGDRFKYQKLPIRKKESYRWLSSCEAAKKNLREASAVVIVQDREGDIYEQFATVPDEQTHLLIRAKTDRSLPGGGKLFSTLSESGPAGTYSIAIEGDKRKGQLKRTAQLEVRFREVTIKNTSRTAKDAVAALTLWCVEAREINAPAEVKQPVCWRLLTTVPVTCLSEALTITEWYSCRWLIEEVFRLVKKEGFDIEASELQSGAAIRKLCLLILDTVIQIFQLRIALDEPEEEGMAAGVCFTQTEMQCMEMQSKKMEGKTEKLKNPFRPSSLKYATWVIARLGGWKGYASERKPGTTTLWIGLEKFYDIYNGWQLVADVSTR
jgi:hypothetical protein